MLNLYLFEFRPYSVSRLFRYVSYLSYYDQNHLNQINMILLLILAVGSLANQAQHLQAPISPTPQPQVHEVIVIGAGVSGIAASKALSDKGTPHLILQARDRIGGRIVSSELDGTQVDLGATFIHNPGNNNMVDQAIKQMNWETVPAKPYLIEYHYKNNKHPTSEEIQKGQKLIKEFQAWAYGYLQTRTQNIDLNSCWNEFSQSKKGLYSEKTFEVAYFELLAEALTSGADLNQYSASFYVTNKEKNGEDYIPKGGYFSVLKAIFERYCHKAQIKFKQVVKTIDYSSAVVKVTTAEGQTYLAKKVISSLPLGVLKAGDVKFIPNLPSGHQEAINKIGFGIFNKIIVTLTDEFWTSGKKVLNFIPPYSELPQNRKFLESYVVSDKNPSLLMFFTGGSLSKELSHLSNAEIVNQLISEIKKYVDPANANFAAKNFTVSRWEQDPYAKGSYSFHGIQTKQSHFTTLSTPIDNKLFFIGEHTEPKQSSNVHGAFKAGFVAANRVSSSLFGLNLNVSLIALLAFLLLTLM